MSDFAVYRPYPEEAAQAALRPVEPTSGWEGLQAQRFHVVSRGDFVPGRLYLPDSTSAKPAPLLLLQHGTGDAMDSVALGMGADWVRNGVAVACIDLPLHGERSSPKLSARLVSGVEQLRDGECLDSETRVLVEEFARQATSDMIRTLDALAILESIDADHIGFMGFSLGAMVGSYLLAHDARPRAAVFAGIGALPDGGDLDPARYLAKSTATSILIVGSEGDENVSSKSSAALFAAAPEPKTRLTFPGTPQPLPKEGIGQIWRFLAKELVV